MTEKHSKQGIAHLEDLVIRERYENLESFAQH